MATITWMLLHLAAKPHLMDDLYREQVEVCGKELRPLAYEDLAKMPVVANVIKEVLRMHPPLHSIIRKVKSPMHVKDTAFTIPTSHYLLACPGASAIDSQFFPNPLDFNPSRWIGDKGEEEGEKFDFGFGIINKGTASPYLPFGAGRHRCIGENFANVQLGTILVTFVREFALSLPGGATEVPGPDYTSMITLPMQPAAVHWKRRDP